MSLAGTLLRARIRVFQPSAADGLQELWGANISATGPGWRHLFSNELVIELHPRGHRGWSVDRQITEARLIIILP